MADQRAAKAVLDHMAAAETLVPELRDRPKKALLRQGAYSGRPMVKLRSHRFPVYECL